MTKRERYCVDPKSRELAEHFLPSTVREELKRELAQVIQDAVEDWIEYKRHRVAEQL